jgi:hypothetical protein
LSLQKEEYWNQEYIVGANLLGILWALEVRPLLRKVSRHPSGKHRSLRVIGRLSSGVFHAMLPVCTQKVETQTVFSRIDFIQKCSPQLDPLGRFQQALEDGELNTLTVVNA